MAEQVSSDISNFDQLAELFLQHAALHSPAELHGYLCGLLSAGNRLTLDSWFQSAATQLGIEEELSAPLRAGLSTLYQVTLAQLEEAGFDLQPLIPDEEVELAQRAEELGLWCHGFLCGYALGKGRPAEQLSEDARDGIRDLSQIAQIAVDEGAEEESEADFIEIYEYVRMVALLVFSECNQRVVSEEGAQLPPDTALH
ncbi:UPF0149 family protein [Motiliproteus sp.]|uniref:UPF0149 family protein n=1 Tax=Motiliproteus sp. TaxID=1898955 RepID=UPI003BA9835E